MNRYETNFVLTPVLSEDQAREIIKKFRGIIEGLKGRVDFQEYWQRGEHHAIIEFHCDGRLIPDLDIAFKRDERVLRFKTVRLVD